MMYLESNQTHRPRAHGENKPPGSAIYLESFNYQTDENAVYITPIIESLKVGKITRKLSSNKQIQNTNANVIRR